MLHSVLPHVVWPAIPDPFHAQVVSVLQQLEVSQWWPEAELRRHQLRQLNALLTHHNRYSAFYRPRLDAFAQGGRTLDERSFRRLPILTRAEMRGAGQGLFNGVLPMGQVQWRESSSSGSSGAPVTVRKTEVNEVFHTALVLRSHIWHGRDFAGSLASIRRYPHGTAMPPGGDDEPAWLSGMTTGPHHRLNSAFTTLSEQMAWLQQVRPALILSYPSLLHAMALAYERAGTAPPELAGLMGFGEVSTPSQRADCRRIFGVPMQDTYSTSEASVLAIECPDMPGTYHVQSEHVILEILDAAGNPCPEGVPGRVVVTDLHNLATPLIRYEIGDVACRGAPCPCGRGLPTLSRIAGRILHMLRLPGGDSLVPDIERQELHRLGPIRQAQAVQRTYDRIELRLAVDRPLTAAEQDAVRAAARHGLHGRPFDIELVEMPDIPRAESGKFEAFLCAMPPQTSGIPHTPV